MPNLARLALKNTKYVWVGRLHQAEGAAKTPDQVSFERETHLSPIPIPGVGRCCMAAYLTAWTWLRLLFEVYNAISDVTYNYTIIKESRNQKCVFENDVWLPTCLSSFCCIRLPLSSSMPLQRKQVEEEAFTIKNSRYHTHTHTHTHP